MNGDSQASGLTYASSHADAMVAVRTRTRLASPGADYGCEHAAAESFAGNWPLPGPRPRRGAWRKMVAGLRAVGSAIEWLFGGVAIVVGLAALAAIPVLQFLSLGYLLEVTARIGRTGRLRDGFVGYRQAARVGGIVVGVWLCLIPLRATATSWRSALLLGPTSDLARHWGWATSAVALLTAAHVSLALWRGGRLRHFLCPLFNPLRVVRELRAGNPYVVARDRAWEFVVALRAPYYFWLGVRGFAGALVWLAPPVTLLALRETSAAAGWLGVFSLAWVLPALPFLQAHLGVEGRFGAMFERRAVRTVFAAAPLAFCLALGFTLLSSLPLYLLKIELLPRDAAWLPSLFFVALILPARMLVGWAYGRGRRRGTPRHWLGRWVGRLGMLPVVGLYVLAVYFTQYTAWYGRWSLYEQHAFLLPVPFVEW